MPQWCDKHQQHTIDETCWQCERDASLSRCPITPADLARLVCAARKASGLTQQQLAARAGIAPNTVYLLEAGADSRVSTVLKVNRVLQFLPQSPDGVIPAAGNVRS